MLHRHVAYLREWSSASLRLLRLFHVQWKEDEGEMFLMCCIIAHTMSLLRVLGLVMSFMQCQELSYVSGNVKRVSMSVGSLGSVKSVSQSVASFGQCQECFTECHVLGIVKSFNESREFQAMSRVFSGVSGECLGVSRVLS